MIGRRATGSRPVRRAGGGLEDRGFEAEAIERALDRLTGVGLVDDEAFARDLAASRVEQGVDAPRIVVELKDRGIAPDLAVRIAGESAPPSDRAERCRELAEDRSRSSRGYAPRCSTGG